MKLKSKIAKAKSAVKIYKKVRKMKKEMNALKASYKTTEFWLVVTGNLALIASALKGIIDPNIAAALAVGLTAIHDFLRTNLKKTVDASDSNVTIGE